MFIRRKKYERILEIAKKDSQKYEEKIKELGKRIYDLKTQNYLLEDKLDQQKGDIYTLNESNKNLIEMNKKLTEWVNKIINDVGIYEVHDERTIQIPIMKRNIRTAVYTNRDDILNDIRPLFDEEIIIPEIRFRKMRG